MKHLDKKFKLVNPETMTVKQLKAKVKRKTVLLLLEANRITKRCRVVSYGDDPYYGYGLSSYEPSHYLACNGIDGESEVEASSLADWREQFLSNKTWVSIYSETYTTADCSAEELCKYLLQLRSSETMIYELYYCFDKGNFYGPLECDFIEGWIHDHLDYHVNVACEQIVNEFKISDEVCLDEYLGNPNEETLRVPNGIKIISTNCFKQNKKLRHVELPDGLLNIDYAAFEGCTNLENIILPQSIFHLGVCVFEGCTNLTEIKLPEALTYAGSYLFEDCKNLKKIQLPKNLTEIKDNFFKGCERLMEVHLPKTITRIGRHAFEGCCSLKSIALPDSLREIDSEAFQNCISLESIFLPNFLTKIRSSTFQGCINLKSIHFPESLTTIDFSAFQGCINLTSIHLPESLTAIGSETFQGCINLKSIHFPESLTAIDSESFRGCVSLTEIYLPKSLDHLSKGLWKDCTNLKKIELPNSIHYIHDQAFMNCTSLQEIQIPQGTLKLGQECFAGSGIQKLSIPCSVRQLGKDCFRKSKLEEINLYADIIKEGAFSECSELRKVFFEKTATNLEDRIFEGCIQLKELLPKKYFRYAIGENYQGVITLMSNTPPNNIFAGVPRGNQETILEGTYVSHSYQGIAYIEKVTPNGLILKKFNDETLQISYFNCCNWTNLNIPEEIKLSSWMKTVNKPLKIGSWIFHWKWKFGQVVEQNDQYLIINFAETVGQKTLSKQWMKEFQDKFVLY
ncbi:MAG: leucine-rich repeat protein [Lachnospiraceae bacterium]